MDNSNQPTPTPPAPEQPAVAPQQPAGQTGAPNYQMPPKKGLSKGALIGIIAGSVGLLLLIVGIVLAVVFLSGPTKEDYREALRVMDEIKKEDFEDFGDSSDPDDIKKAINDGLAKFDEKNKELKSTKAMRDSEVKKAFDEYIKEYDAAKVILTEMADSMAIYQKYSDDCIDTDYISTSGKTAEEAGKMFDDEYASCSKTLDEMEKSDKSDVSKFAKTWKDYLKEMRKYYVGVAEWAASDDYSIEYPDYPDYPDVDSPMEEVFNKLGKNKLQERSEDLYELVEDKISKSE